MDEDGGLSCKRLFLGGATVAAAKAAAAPAERVKILLQVQIAQKTIPKEARYTGPLDCFSRICREQGARSFWRGNLYNVFHFIPTQVLGFALKDAFKPIFIPEAVDKEKEFWKFLRGNVLSGSSSGAAVLLFSHPFDYARTRLAADVGTSPKDREFRGFANCLRRSYRSEGLVRGLYPGYLTAVQGIIVYRGIYFGVYDTAKDFLTDNQICEIAGGRSFVLALSVASAASATSYPFEVVRRRMAMATNVEKGVERAYEGTWDCWRKTALAEGARGFYRGFSAGAVQAVVAASMLVSLDRLKTEAQSEYSRRRSGMVGGGSSPSVY